MYIAKTAYYHMKEIGLFYNNRLQFALQSSYGCQNHPHYLIRNTQSLFSAQHVAFYDTFTTEKDPLENQNIVVENNVLIRHKNAQSTNFLLYRFVWNPVS